MPIQFVEVSDWAGWLNDVQNNGQEPCCVVIDLDPLGPIPPIDEIIRSVVGFGNAILVSSDADLSLARRVFACGGFDLLAKPIQWSDLLRSIQRAATELRARVSSEAEDVSFQAALEQLTPREGEYLKYLLGGWSIKALANHFGVSIQTAAKHRARVLRKLEAENEVELVYRFGLRTPPACAVLGSE
ncbi:MAG: LuxR C-terminal-related transcriptional regulator [Pirellulaceae bacterium]